MRAMPHPVSVRRIGVAGSAATLALAAALIGVVPAHAQPGPPGDEPSTTWGLGVGFGSKQQPYAGISRDNQVLPLLEFENRYVHLLGPALEVKLPNYAISDTQRLKFRLGGYYAILGGYKPDDAQILEGMTERKDGFWAGGKIEWETSLITVGALWMHDISGYSKGQRFALGLEKDFRLGQRVMLIPRAAAIWQDAKLNNYYYGVTAAEAEPGRPAYQAGSGVNAEVGLRGIFLFDKHSSVFLDLSVNTLSSQIKNSPLVDRSTENRVLVAYVYRF